MALTPIPQLKRGMDTIEHGGVVYTGIDMSGNYVVVFSDSTVVKVKYGEAFDKFYATYEKMD